MLSIVIAILSIIAIFLTIAFVSKRVSLQKEKDIIQNGFKVDAIVIQSKEIGAGTNKRHRCYVMYTSQNGVPCGVWVNTPTNLPIWSIVKIKYLPPNYDYAVFISQEI